MYRKCSGNIENYKPGVCAKLLVVRLKAFDYSRDAKLIVPFGTIKGSGNNGEYN